MSLHDIIQKNMEEFDRKFPILQKKIETLHRPGTMHERYIEPNAERTGDKGRLGDRPTNPDLRADTLPELLEKFEKDYHEFYFESGKYNNRNQGYPTCETYFLSAIAEAYNAGEKARPLKQK